MSKLRHVFPIAGQFSFRLALPGQRFVCAERWATERECALSADFFKLVLVKKYGLKGYSVSPSLPLEEFKTVLHEAGLDPRLPSFLSDLVLQCPESCKEFFRYGAEEMQEFMKSEIDTRKKGFGDLV